MSTATLTAPASSLTLPSSDRVLFSTPAVIEDYRIDERCQPYAKPGADGLSVHGTKIKRWSWSHSGYVLTVSG